MLSKQQLIREDARLARIKERKIAADVFRAMHEIEKRMDAEFLRKGCLSDEFQVTLSFVFPLCADVLLRLKERLTEDYANAWPGYVFSMEAINGSGFYTIRLYKQRLIAYRQLLIS